MFVEVGMLPILSAIGLSLVVGGLIGWFVPRDPGEKLGDEAEDWLRGRGPDGPTGPGGPPGRG